MDLSVVIVNYNVEHFLEQCLNSCRAAIKSLEVEIWVVDNNSIDGSIDMIKQKFPEVKLIENKENAGFSKANNQAIKASSGRYTLLLNPDTVVQEDTFEKVVAFMDEHPKAGGLGVKMVDGKGKFLPESKRGLPTPSVAFYKIFGFSRLFPKSKKFGKYHLGYLNNDETHEIEILSGAFMMMRKEVLDKIGLLDEDFFMYGEDIDLSYRIIKGGYSNYYLPTTRIIHYKGESTKKSSVNYVFVFYNAMIIFARKHFSQKNAKAFSFLINLAIYFRAFAAIVSRVVKRSIIPLVDISAIIAILYAVSHYYQEFNNIVFPKEVVNIIVPSYAIFWVLSIYLSGGYDKPQSLLKILKGLIAGSIIILASYGLMDKSHQFSRLFVAFGSIFTILGLLKLRLLYHLIKLPGFSINSRNNTRFAIVGDQEECIRVSNLLQHTHPKIEFLGFIKNDNEEIDKEVFLGTWNQINQIMHIHKIDELIFCAKDVSAEATISAMSTLESNLLDFKIAQPESLYLIGSNSIETSGDLYMLDVNSIAKAANRRNKRIFDLLASTAILTSYPLIIWFINNKVKALINTFNVLLGRKTWVGYFKSEEINLQLPKLKNSVLDVTDGIVRHSDNTSEFNKLNIIYAKNYRMRTDFKVVISSIKHLGR